MTAAGVFLKWCATRYLRVTTTLQSNVCSVAILQQISNILSTTKHIVMSYVSVVRLRHPACESLSVKTRSSEAEPSLSVYKAQVNPSTIHLPTSSIAGWAAIQQHHFSCGSHAQLNATQTKHANADTHTHTHTHRPCKSIKERYSIIALKVSLNPINHASQFQ